VLASQYAMLRRQGRREADLTPERLADVFASQLRRVREWVASQPHFSAIEVDYHSAINNPVAQARRLNAFLGGVLDEARMAAAVDPSLYRQRQGAGDIS
jgi:hypothetical protein